jgi:methylenetetrahydrofolate dehydrogenase (NADP+) / methenyltetrahydrofolate cyclohydrolase
MDSKLIDGKALAKSHEEALKNKLSSLNPKRKPTIVSFCNREDGPSVKYTEMKRQKAYEIGIDFIVEEYSLTTVKDEIVEKIQRYNVDGNVDGIMMQLPIPEELNIFQQDFLEVLDPEKDVDGLVENSPFLPATVKAVISILEECVPDWKSKTVGVVGSTGEVGKPLVKYLKENGVNVIETSRTVGDLENDLKVADVVISCVGKEHLIKPEMIKMEVVLIDVGLGDFDPGCFEKASFYTPKFGGVGPMTVISLMENAVDSFEERM